MLEGRALRPTPVTDMLGNFYGVSLVYGCTPPIAPGRWPVVGEMGALQESLDRANQWSSTCFILRCPAKREHRQRSNDQRLRGAGPMTYPKQL
jgi:hypothetical protein